MCGPTVVFSPTPAGTMVLMRWGHHERLKAMLPRSCQGRRQGVPLLLEGLAEVYQRRLSVVLAVDGHPNTPDLGLCNDLGGGADTLHYDVEVVDLSQRGLRLHGIPGDFSQLRRFLPRRIG